MPLATPEAVEVALVVLAALTVKSPPEVTERPSGMVALASLSAMLTVTAAATHLAVGTTGRGRGRIAAGVADTVG